MMDHLSSKVCAAAGSICIPIQAGTAAIATILEKRRIIASQANGEANGQCKVMRLRSCTLRNSGRGKKVNESQGFRTIMFRRTAAREHQNCGGDIAESI